MWGHYPIYIFILFQNFELLRLMSRTTNQTPPPRKMCISDGLHIFPCGFNCGPYQGWLTRWLLITWFYFYEQCSWYLHFFLKIFCWCFFSYIFYWRGQWKPCMFPTWNKSLECGPVWATHWGQHIGVFNLSPHPLY